MRDSISLKVRFVARLFFGVGVESGAVQQRFDILLDDTITEFVGLMPSDSNVLMSMSTRLVVPVFHPALANRWIKLDGWWC